MSNDPSPAIVEPPLSPKLVDAVNQLVGQVQTHRHLYARRDFAAPWEVCPECREVASSIVFWALREPRAAIAAMEEDPDVLVLRGGSPEMVPGTQAAAPGLVLRGSERLPMTPAASGRPVGTSAPVDESEAALVTRWKSFETAGEKYAYQCGVLDGGYSAAREKRLRDALEAMATALGKHGCWNPSNEEPTRGCGYCRSAMKAHGAALSEQEAPRD